MQRVVAAARPTVESVARAVSAVGVEAQARSSEMQVKVLSKVEYYSDWERRSGYQVEMEGAIWQIAFGIAYDRQRMVEMQRNGGRMRRALLGKETHFVSDIEVVIRTVEPSQVEGLLSRFKEAGVGNTLEISDQDKDFIKDLYRSCHVRGTLGHARSFRSFIDRVAKANPQYANLCAAVEDDFYCVSSKFSGGEPNDSLRGFGPTEHLTRYTNDDGVIILGVDRLVHTIIFPDGTTLKAD